MRRYRRNSFQLTSPEFPPLVGAASITQRTTLGILVNPRYHEPLLALTDGNYVSIRSLQQDRLLRKIGTGYFDDHRQACTEATGLPRCHTPDGVKPRGEGYGTTLYSALCVAAQLVHQTDAVTISMWRPGDGVSSEEGDRTTAADAWWSAANERGLTESQTDEETELEEGVDVTRRVDADELEQVLGDVDGDVVYVNDVNVDIEKTVERTFDSYTYASCREHHLLLAEVVVPDIAGHDAESNLDYLWRQVLDKPTDWIWDSDPEALLAVDVRGVSLGALNLLSLLYLHADLDDAAVDALRQRWEHGLDPDESTGQQHLFRANAAGMADVRWAREQVGWDRLDLP